MSARPRPGVQQRWNLMPIFLIGKSLPGGLTAWIEAAARRMRSRRQSQPRFKGTVRPATGQKGRGEESSQLGRLLGTLLFSLFTSFFAYDDPGMRNHRIPRLPPHPLPQNVSDGRRSEKSHCRFSLDAPAVCQLFRRTPTVQASNGVTGHMLPLQNYCGVCADGPGGGRGSNGRPLSRWRRIRSTTRESVIKEMRRIRPPQGQSSGSASKIVRIRRAHVVRHVS